MAAATRRVGYVRLAMAGLVLVPLSWAVISRAQETEVAPAPAASATTADAIRREMAIQEQRHKERVAELEALKTRVAAEASDEAKADARRLDDIIAKEQRDYAARRLVLQELLAADPGVAGLRNDAAEVREWNSLANAVGRLNQSYVVAPVISDYAASGGSYYIDREVPLRRVDPRVGEIEGVEPGVARVDWVRLPPPLYVGSGGVRALPRWLYGYGDWPVGVPVGGTLPRDEEVLRLRQNVRELSKEVEDLKQRRGVAPVEPTNPEPKP
ncbi:MAG: hypothetical protein WED34_21970 [Planctomycetales bacterium]